MKFYCRVHNNVTDEVWELLVAHGAPSIALKVMLKRFPEYHNMLTATTIVTLPQADDNNECYRISTVRELPQGTYFRVVKRDGSVGKNVFVRGQYDKSINRYDCPYFNDFLCSSRQFKANQRVCIDFTF